MSDLPRPLRAPRSFPSPWTVVQIPGGFRVQDANRRALAYVYYHLESTGREDEFLTLLEAQRLASHIAESPNLSAAPVAARDQDPTAPQ